VHAIIKSLDERALERSSTPSCGVWRRVFRAGL